MNNKAFSKLGWLFIILSCLFWILLAVIPFLPFSVGIKAVVATGSIVLAEVFFWIGAILVGKEVMKKYKAYLTPKKWKKKREEEERGQTKSILKTERDK
ncbi:transporter suffix domain-containing protein [Radiobacillus kanasensis]|uniref:transporter suffix domain-containing protein n=1 Tax=Radiobacillus kanasensis TaxID=2844358 RepID=UPI001E3F2E84|nr:transporter suffix domain-containing protein [Radiobacillus kanasensis]UFT99107.1 transporter suffix domain-containing protein [Radiobacillus kanasensis]